MERFLILRKFLEHKQVEIQSMTMVNNKGKELIVILDNDNIPIIILGDDDFYISYEMLLQNGLLHYELDEIQRLIKATYLSDSFIFTNQDETCYYLIGNETESKVDVKQKSDITELEECIIDVIELPFAMDKMENIDYKIIAL